MVYEIWNANKYYYFIFVLQSNKGRNLIKFQILRFKVLWSIEFFKRVLKEDFKSLNQFNLKFVKTWLNTFLFINQIINNKLLLLGFFQNTVKEKLK